MKALLILLLLSSSLLFAKAIPTNSGPVIDQAGVFSRHEKQAISESLRQLKQSIGTEVQVLIVDSLDGDNIENYSIAVVDEWKIGSKQKDDGVLFLIAIKDRKMRIEVGDGLEGELTDLKASRIISQVTPYFKQGKYRDGIIVGTSLIAQTIGGELKAAPTVRRTRRKSGGMSIVSILFFIIFFALSSGRGGRGGRGGGILNALILGSMLSGGRSSSGFSSGGGSFGGGSFGGGGGFSGGGASGGW